jgi:hypothetical protein
VSPKAAATINDSPRAVRMCVHDTPNSVQSIAVSVRPTSARMTRPTTGERSRGTRREMTELSGRIRESTLG